MKRKKGSSVERVMQIIEMVAEAPRPVSPAELSLQLEIPKPSIHRLIKQLQEEGFLAIDVQGGVICGHRTHKLMMNLLKTNFIYKSERQAVLQKLCNKIEETVGIAFIHDLEIVYMDRVLSNWPLQIHIPEGHQIPIWASASGKLLLSYLPKEQRKKVIDSMPLQALTKNTMIDKAALLTCLEQTNKNGYGVDNEEFIPGMVACSVPVPNGDKRPYATIFTHAPTVRKSMDELLTYLDDMHLAAAELAAIFAALE
ncbi:MAG: IclR family transcriptional regulator [Alcaligenaceae bacterium]|nr:IclR family transcriptional regulator [Alcaligenaceae bacterium]